MFLSLPVHAEETKILTVKVSATLQQLLNTQECESDISDPVCEDITYMPEQPHPCVKKPKQTGCQYYKPDEAK